MKNYTRIPQLVFIIVFLFGISNVYSQDGFTILKNRNKDVIPFDLVNNLVIVPVEVNGTELSFLLDTGVNSTIIFSVADEDSLRINNASKVKLRGLGEGGTVDAYKSEGNVVKIGDAVDNNHSLYFIFETSLNFSPRMGIPVHGILGYDFFKSFVVNTNYITRRLTIHNPQTYNLTKCRRCDEFDLTFFNNKPYINATISNEIETEEVRLLIDTGSSDALWLFREEKYITELETASFDDFLGFGLSGNIYGKRSKLVSTTIGKFTLREVKVAYPEEKALYNIQLFGGRDGSLGGEILKRFNITIDYSSKKMMLRKNSFYFDPFHYNMSGLTLEHDGLTAVREVTESHNSMPDGRNLITSDTGVNIPIKKIANFYLAPKYSVAEVRPNSPAAEADIRVGDEILAVNGNAAYKYKLYELVEMFYSREGKRINMLIRRQGHVTMKKHFTLKKVL